MSFGKPIVARGNTAENTMRGGGQSEIVSSITRLRDNTISERFLFFEGTKTVQQAVDCNTNVLEHPVYGIPVLQYCYCTRLRDELNHFFFSFSF